MKFWAALMVALAVFGVSQARAPTQEKYKYDGVILTGVLNPSQSYSGSRIYTEISVHRTDDASQVTFENSKAAVFNKNSSYLTPPGINNFERMHELDGEVVAYFEKNSGNVMEVDEQERSWVTNIRKAILQLLRVPPYVNTREFADLANNRVNRQQSRISSSGGDTDMRSYFKREATFAGMCNVSYTSYRDNNFGYWPNSPLNIVSNANYYRMHRSIDFDSCWDLIAFQKSTFGNFSQSTKSQMKELQSRSAVAEYLIRTMDNDEVAIIGAVQRGTHEVRPFGQETGRLIAFTNQTLVLLSQERSSRSLSSRHESRNGKKQISNWSYQFVSPNSPKPDTKVDHIFYQSKNEDDTPIYPEYAVLGEPTISEQHAISRVRDILRDISAKVFTPNEEHKMPYNGTKDGRIAETVHLVARILRTMRKHSLDSLFDEFSSKQTATKKSTPADIASQMFVDALAATGSAGGIKTLIEKYNNKSISAPRMALLIMTYTNNLIDSGGMKTVMDFVMKQNPDTFILWSVAHLNFARMARLVCTDRETKSYAVPQAYLGTKECDAHMIENDFVRHLEEKIKNSQRDMEKLLYIQTLGRTGARNALPILRDIIHDRNSHSVHCRVQAVYSMAHSYKNLEEKRAVIDMLLPVAESHTEAFPLRQAAFVWLIHNNVNATVYQRFALNSWHEPSYQMRALVTSAFTSLARSTDTKESKVIGIARKYLNEIKQVTPSYKNSLYFENRNEVRDYKIAVHTRKAWLNELRPVSEPGQFLASLLVNYGGIKVPITEVFSLVESNDHMSSSMSSWPPSGPQQQGRNQQRHQQSWQQDQEQLESQQQQGRRQRHPQYQQELESQQQQGRNQQTYPPGWQGQQQLEGQQQQGRTQQRHQQYQQELESQKQQGRQQRHEQYQQELESQQQQGRHPRHQQYQQELESQQQQGRKPRYQQYQQELESQQQQGRRQRHQQDWQQGEQQLESQQHNRQHHSRQQEREYMPQQELYSQQGRQQYRQQQRSQQGDFSNEQGRAINDQINRIADAMNLEMVTSEGKVYMFFSMMDLQAYLPLDKATIMKIYQELKEATQSKSHERGIPAFPSHFTNPMEIIHILPTAMGLPSMLEIRFPTNSFMGADHEAHSENHRWNITLHGGVKTTKKAQTYLSTFLPWKNSSACTGYDTETTASTYGTVTFQVDLSSNKPVVRLIVSPDFPNESPVMYYRSKPFTAIRPIGPDSDITMVTDFITPLANFSHSYNKTIELPKKLFGLKGRIMFQGDTAFPFQRNTYLSTMMVPECLVTLLTSPSKHDLTLVLKLNMEQSETKNMSFATVTDFGYISDRHAFKSATTQTQQQEFVKKALNVSSTMSPEALVSESVKRQLGDFVFSTSVNFTVPGRFERRYLAAVIGQNQSHDNPSELRQSIVAVFSKSGIPGEPEESKICIKTDITEKTQPQSNRNFTNAWTDLLVNMCNNPSDKVASMQTSLKLAYDETQPLRSSPGEAKNIMPPERRYDPSTSYTWFPNSVYEQVIFHLNWSQSIPRNVANATKNTLDILTGLVFPHVVTNHYPEHHMQNEARINVTRNMHGGTVGVRVEQPESTYSIQDILVPGAFDWMTPLVGYSKTYRHAPSDRSSSRLSALEATPGKVCTVKPSEISTYDGVQFSRKVATCPYIVSKYYTSQGSFVVLTRQAEKSESSDTEVTLLMTAPSVKVEIKREQQVEINGKRIEIENSQVRINSTSGQVIGTFRNSSDRLEIIISGKIKLTLINKTELKIAVESERYRKTLKGLCGDFNSEKQRDMLSPKKCVFRPEEGPLYSASWIFEKSQCQDQELKELIAEVDKRESNQCRAVSNRRPRRQQQP